MKELTYRQREVLNFIVQYISEHGFPPAMREIGKRFGIKSMNGVNDHLRALVRKGCLKREHLKSRTLRPTAVKPGLMWLVGHWCKGDNINREWVFRGVFSTYEKAEAACHGENYFVFAFDGPDVELHVNDEAMRVVWPKRKGRK